LQLIIARLVEGLQRSLPKTASSWNFHGNDQDGFSVAVPAVAAVLTLLESIADKTRFH
jgi:hypothetical protein